MAPEKVSKKRKSLDGSGTAPKKVKVSKAAETPATRSASKPKPSVSSITNTAAAKPVKGKSAAADIKASKVKTTKPAKEEEIKVTLEDSDDVEGDDELTADQTAALLAGFSDSEEEDQGLEADTVAAYDSDDSDGLEISTLPKAPTTGDIQKRIKKAVSDQADPENTPGVIFVGRIPHGFYEKQMRAYLEQFGEITNLRLARNNKTGKSQHYAFVEFASAAVSDIVAKTMDKYLLFGHLLQVRKVPREQIKEGIWNRAGKRKPVPRNKLEGGRLKKGMDKEEWQKRISKEEQRRAKKAEQLKDMGYEYKMPALKNANEVGSAGVSAVEAAQPAPAVIEAAEPALLNTTGESKKRSAAGKTSTKKAVKKTKVGA